MYPQSKNLIQIELACIFVTFGASVDIGEGIEVAKFNSCPLLFRH